TRPGTSDAPCGASSTAACSPRGSSGSAAPTAARRTWWPSLARTEASARAAPRRAADTAARLVDEVLPHVPLRQWVLALPPALHLRVASDPELEGKLLRSFSEELEELRRATTRAGERGRGGNVTFLQHFGSALNLHLNFH